MTDELRPAFQSYAGVDPTAADGDGLNLAWTRDERECLAVDLDAVLADELRAEIAGPRALDQYLVRDPHGEETLGPSIASAFALETWRDRITCGAGVLSLLHGLTRLAARDTVRFIGDLYPDVPYWVAQHASATGPAIWFVERPGLVGDAHASLDSISTASDEAAKANAIVVVDESNANYYPPAWSAISLNRENVIVARGFSKAYGLGSLRLGYCVAAPALTARIRTVIAPLLASSLSLRFGARILALGDLAAPLRTRIADHKREMTELLVRAGVDDLVPASEHLPYVLSRGSATRLERLVGKIHPFWASGALDHLYRLSVPLSEARMSVLRQLLR
ncbi:MAG TPA: aminotransferase class I/II-fold pyridoxal phosphate-dependent enzyme [Kofleriaceae bacterium]|jgi:hypothetical protein